MEYIDTKFIIKASLNLQNFNGNFFFETKIEKKINIPCDSQLKDVCSDVMNSIGLGHLSHLAKVSIKTCTSNYFTLDSLIPNLTVNMGSLKLIFGNSITIQIFVNGNADDFSQCELGKTLCCNLLQLIVKKYSSIKDCITDSSLKEIINELEKDSVKHFSYEYLQGLNTFVRDQLISLTKNDEEPTEMILPIKEEKKDILEMEGLQKVNNDSNTNLYTLPEPSKFINDLINTELNETEQFNNQSPNLKKSFLKILNTSLSPKEVPETLFTPVKSHKYRSRITFDQHVETPVLEKWFSLTKKPSPLQLQQIADYLNDTASRPEDVRVTTQNVKIWFKNRRAKGRKSK